MPDLRDLPTTAKVAVEAWRSAYQDMLQAERGVLAARAAFAENHTERDAEARRAFAEGTTHDWPEQRAELAARDRLERLRVVVQIRHDEAAWAVNDAAGEALTAVDRTKLPAAVADVATAVAALETALHRLSDTSALWSFWSNVDQANGGGGIATEVQFVPDGAVTVVNSYGARSRKSVNALLAEVKRAAA